MDAALFQQGETLDKLIAEESLKLRRRLREEHRTEWAQAALGNSWKLLSKNRGF
ncbi:MAG: hypothetical protein AB1453_06420 [Chloroflexota bacterium]|jgi:hypothetical protein